MCGETLRVPEAAHDSIYVRRPPPPPPPPTTTAKKGTGRRDKGVRARDERSARDLGTTRLFFLFMVLLDYYTRSCAWPCRYIRAEPRSGSTKSLLRELPPTSKIRAVPVIDSSCMSQAVVSLCTRPPASLAAAPASALAGGTTTTQRSVATAIDPRAAERVGSHTRIHTGF
jgi:hypothetical protein